MKTIAALCITIFLCLTVPAFGELSVERAVKADWMDDKLQVIGMVTSLCLYQSMNGLVESHKFGGTHLSSDAYHLARTGQSLSGLSAGYFLYANIQDRDTGWKKKSMHVIGAGCIARNAFEWTYRWNVTGNMFDYREKWSCNGKAIVYFTVSDWKVRDAYVSGYGVYGAVIDAAYLIVGYFLVTR